MKCDRFWQIQRKTSIVLAATLMVVSIAAAKAKEMVLIRFNGKDGANSFADLTFDSRGNLYGTTLSGGTRGSCGGFGCGVVFKLLPSAKGGWTEAVIYDFKDSPDASNPIGGVVFDKQGNLYGATLSGGTQGLGTVFKLTPIGGGEWKERIIHSFPTGDDGFTPFGDLTIDAKGNLYGVTESGSGTGSFGGDVFELSPQSDGTWKEAILYNFDHPGDGKLDFGGVVFDKKGNLYGSTFYGDGGDDSCGTVFELTPTPTGEWTRTILYDFPKCSIGGSLHSPLIFDSAGNLYGTGWGNPNGVGTVYKLSPGSGGNWQAVLLYNFESLTDNGGRPVGRLAFDRKGNLYGATWQGGKGCNSPGCGTIFKLKPQVGGGWKEAVLHNFQSGNDGSEPYSGLLLDQAGNIYGSTQFGGGGFGYGTVFQIKP